MNGLLMRGNHPNAAFGRARGEARQDRSQGDPALEIRDVSTGGGGCDAEVVRSNPRPYDAFGNTAAERRRPSRLGVLAHRKHGVLGEPVRQRGDCFPKSRRTHVVGDGQPCSSQEMPRRLPSAGRGVGAMLKWPALWSLEMLQAELKWEMSVGTYP